MTAVMARQEGGIRYSSQTAGHNIHQHKPTRFTALQAWLPQQGRQLVMLPSVLPLLCFLLQPWIPRVGKRSLLCRKLFASTELLFCHCDLLEHVATAWQTWTIQDTFRSNSEMLCLFPKRNWVPNISLKRDNYTSYIKCPRQLHIRTK